MGRKPKLTKVNIQKLFRIVKPRIDPKTGKRTGWKGVAKASRELKVTSRTIYNYLEEYEKAPEREPRTKRVKPKIIAKFEKTEAWETIRDHKYETELKNTLMHAWSYLDYVDPVTWTMDHVKALRESKYKDELNPLWLEETGDIGPEHATQIRRFWAELDLPQIPTYLRKMKDVPKRPEGVRKEWYLEPEEIFRLIPCIHELSTLVFVRKTLEDGARPIATAGKSIKGRTIPKNLRFMPEQIDPKRNVIRRWESKKRKWARAKFQTETIHFILRYINDAGIRQGEDVFKYNQNFYSKRIKEAGIRAKIPLIVGEGGGAYILRHTFATQALSHNVSLECVMEQGGWKGSETLMKYYAGLKEEKMDLDFLDIKPERIMTWKEWILQFDKSFKEQYEKLLRKAPKIKKKKKIKPSKPRKINWDAVKKMVKTKKTPEHLKKAWKKALKLHEEGFSDYEVRTKMGWKK